MNSGAYRKEILAAAVAWGFVSLLRAETDPPDGHPRQPLVSIVSPVQGSTASSFVNVQVSAAPSDSGGTVSRVELFVDGGLWKTDVSAPYSFQIFLDPGLHNLLARAYEPARGENGQSYLTHIAVGQSPPPAPAPSAWQTSFAAAGPARQPAMALDAADNPHAAYILGDSLHYGRWNGAAWQSETVAGGASRMRNVLIALDRSGSAHIAYILQEPFINSVHYAHKSGASWSIETVSTGNPTSASIGVLSDNSVRIALTRNQNSTSELRYASRSAAGWTSVVIDSHDWVYDNAALAVDPAGRAKIAYTVNNHHAPNSAELRLAEWEGYWKISHVLTAIAGGAVQSVSMAIDGAGAPRVAFISADRKLAYAVKYDNGNSNNWAAEVVASSVTAAGASLSLSRAGAVYVAYVADAKLKLAHRDRGFWHPQDVDANASGSPAVRIGADSRPYLLYQSTRSAGIRFARSEPVEDGQAPEIAVSTPAPGSAVAGLVTVAGTARDNAALARVEVRIGSGAYAAAAGAQSWSYALDTEPYQGEQAISARATDASGNVRAATVTVRVDNTPRISAAGLSWVGPSSATVFWTTDKPADSQAEYGESPELGSFTPLAAVLASTHAHTLTGLAASTSYYFRARSADSRGRLALSAAATFCTRAQPDATPPTLFILSPASGSALSGAAAISGTAADDQGLSRIEVQVDGATAAQASGLRDWTFSWDTTAVSSGLHRLAFTAVDWSGNRAGGEIDLYVQHLAASSGSASSDPTSLPPPPPPSLPPNPLTISGVSVLSVAQRSAVIAWHQGFAAPSEIEFGIGDTFTSKVSGQELASQAVQIDGLCPNTTYHYRIRALSPDGNWRASDVGAFRTARLNIQNLAISPGSLILSWEYSQDGNFSEFAVFKSTAGYPALDGSDPVYRGRDPYFGDSQVEAGVRYYYAVAALNRFGGWSSNLSRISSIARQDRVLWKLVEPDGESFLFFGHNSLGFPSGNFFDATEVSVAVQDEGSAQRALARLHSSGMRSYGDIIHFGPDGLVFDSPPGLMLCYEDVDLRGMPDDALKIAYWNPRADEWEVLDSEVNPIQKHLTARIRHFSTYAIVAKASDAPLLLRSAFAYPNPAQQRVTLRVDAGSAASVRFTVYDDAGRRVHGATVTQPVFKDGAFVHEHGWDAAGAPSGTYLFIAEIEKPGAEPISAKAKFAILR